MSSDTKPLHFCGPELAFAPDNQEAHGPAVTFCAENQSGYFWACNNEYASRVNFCPFCGAKAPAQVPGSEEVK